MFVCGGVTGVWSVCSGSRRRRSCSDGAEAVLEMSSNLSQVGVQGAWSDDLQVVFVVADCVVLLVTFLLGSAANVFVVHAVRRHKSLRTATNALLVNLALVDLLRCATDCPLLLLIVLRARGPRVDLGLALCSAQLASFCLSCGAQLLSVAGISVERHRAVTRPFESGGSGGERRRRVAVWISFTWVAPALMSALCARFAPDTPVYARCRGARAYEPYTRGSFGRYVLLPAWCACLAVIAACYGHIYVVVRAHGRKVFDKGVTPAPREKGGEKKEEKSPGTKRDDKDPQIAAVHGTVETAPPIEGPANAPSLSDSQTPLASTKDTLVSELCEDARNVERAEEPSAQSAPVTHEDAQQQEAHETDSQVIDLKGDEARGNAHEDEHQDAHEDAQQDAHETEHEVIDLKGAEAFPVNLDAQEKAQHDAQGNAQQVAHEAEHQNAPESALQGGEVMGAVCMMPSFANRERINKKKESKLAKRSGYIIFTFLIFWLPLIGTIVLNVLLDKQEDPGVSLNHSFVISIIFHHKQD